MWRYNGMGSVGLDLGGVDWVGLGWVDMGRYGSLLRDVVGCVKIQWESRRNVR